MKAIDVFQQNDGEVTRAYYKQLAAIGPAAPVAVALFRAQKRSTRAKQYRGGRFRRAAYDVKQWSLDQLCEVLACYPSLGIGYGWKEDTAATSTGDPNSWVLYVDLPQGQVSFHSPVRGKGPTYPGEWDQSRMSAERILQFCDLVSSEVRD